VSESPVTERLQKIMAAAGVGSRRQCEDLIGKGRVSVDGVPVDRQGVRVDPATAVIRVDGERVRVGTDRTYLAFNKPTGVVTTMSDELGRPSIADVPALRSYQGSKRLFHVGRLDAETEGLLLLTNDGELAHRLMHPSFEVSKTYLAEVSSAVTLATRRLLKEGVMLDDGPASVDGVKIVDSVPGRVLLEIKLHEGRNHLVRRLLAAVGHPVRRLVRVELGPIRLGDLRSGSIKPLSRQDISALYRLVDLD
jgi:23S rRNA pseudouridine2605 synthase